MNGFSHVLTSTRNSARHLCHARSGSYWNKAMLGKRLAGFHLQMIWQGRELVFMIIPLSWRFWVKNSEKCVFQQLFYIV